MSEKLKQAEKAIEEVFGDTSVSPQKTREDLESLASKIETMLDSLPGDDFEDTEEP